MPQKLLSRQEAPFAKADEDTFGLATVREVWQTDEGEKIYWKYSLPDAVQIFALTDEGSAIAISEFQPGVGAEYLHLPGETMESGETPLQTAVRGLLEETGYKAGRMKLLSSILENSGRSDRLIHFFLMTHCKKSEQPKEEGITVVTLPPRELWDRLMQYFGTNPEYKHGGGNTLKALTLGFQELGFFRF